jgi:putative ABC transport system permease protein
MASLIEALTIGLILSLLALGVFISFRVFRFSDITPDGSITLGASVTAFLLVQKVDPFLATAAAFGAGLLAGMTTGILHTRFKIDQLLSGILVMTALYTINLRIMGKSNIPLNDQTTLATYSERFGYTLLAGRTQIDLMGWQLTASEVALLFLGWMAVMVIGVALYAFFRTELGTAMRATGDNPQMMTAQGVNVGNMTVLGLALANGLVALSGSLWAQKLEFADVQMGIGMVVWGLASVIIGEALVGSRQLGLLITGAVMGSVLFRLLTAIALRAGLEANDLKLITAGFVFVALVLPSLASRLRKGISQVKHA